MNHLFASLFIVVLSLSSATASAAQDRTTENLAAYHTHVLVNLYHELGAHAEANGKLGLALHYYTQAADLSLDERVLMQSTQPKFCGTFTQYERQNASGRTYCAATLESCTLVLTAAERVVPTNVGQTLTKHCGPVYGK